MQNPSADRDYLKRLPPEFYRGQACVHWSMTSEDRKTGWLVPVFYCKFRELLTHAMFRYGICCPIFCLMPDHMHLLWLGLLDKADQRLAMKFLRRQLNLVLGKLDVQLQDQPYDHVLREDERQLAALQSVVEYIGRNPERKQLVPIDGFREYPLPGMSDPRLSRSETVSVRFLDSVRPPVFQTPPPRHDSRRTRGRRSPVAEVVRLRTHR